MIGLAGRRLLVAAMIKTDKKHEYKTYSTAGTAASQTLTV